MIALMYILGFLVGGLGWYVLLRLGLGRRLSPWKRDSEDATVEIIFSIMVGAATARLFGGLYILS